MKKSLIKGIIIIVFLIILIIVAVDFIGTIKKPLKITGDEVITVNEGDSFYSVLEKLKLENKIESTFFIKLYMKLSGIKAEVYPGNHTISKNFSVKEFVETLNEHKDNGITITIPEGYTIEDIAELLEKEGLCQSEEFINSIKNYPLPNYVKNNSEKRYNLEGYLFPDTYIINKDTTSNEIIEMMLQRFKEMWNKACKELNLSIDEDKIESILTIASMIEKEATLDNERNIIASVIYNRLKVNMPLQIDATVIYALGYHVEQVLYSYLETDSPYNTYIYSGIPIGPICNPGYKSIVAALSPAQTDYLYYLVESEGKHFFTNSYDAFEEKRQELGYED